MPSWFCCTTTFHPDDYGGAFFWERTAGIDGLLKSIGAVCADWDCATGNCDEEFILLDYTIINQEEGKPQYQAVLQLNVSASNSDDISSYGCWLYRWRWELGQG